MRARALAGIAVAAWSKTAMVASAAQPASASPNHTTVPVVPAPVPPVTATCQQGPMLSGPTVSGIGSFTTVSAGAFSNPSYKACPAANLSLDATSDNAHWKRIDSVHMDQGVGTASQVGNVSHGCLPGNWTYRVLALADDGSYKSSQRATFAC